MTSKKFTPFLYFLGAFMLALGVKYLLKDQPKTQTIGLANLDLEQTVEAIPNRIS